MIELKHIKKEYENVTPLKDINEVIQDGEVVAIIGPSGCGKSTLLRMLNLLEKPTSGQIFIDGEEITHPDFEPYKLREKVGMVFQSFNLFNHKTLIENVCYAPIVIKGEDPSQAYDEGMKLLNKVGLGRFAFQYPRTLSGGQKQRAAIARTIAMKPKVILFDEPTSALDPTMVGEVEGVIRRLTKEGYTILIVTHDMAFAESIATRVLFLNEGIVYEEGTSEEIFQHPKKEKTQLFINKLKGFSCSIDSEDYDFMALYTDLDRFCLTNQIPFDEGKKIKAIFEELVFQILIPKRNKDGGTAEINISYNSRDKATIMMTLWDGFIPDFQAEENKIPMEIIRHFSSALELSENSCKIIVNEE